MHTEGIFIFMAHVEQLPKGNDTFMVKAMNAAGNAGFEERP